MWPNGEAVIAKLKRPPRSHLAHSTVTSTHIADTVMVAGLMEHLGGAVLRMRGSAASYLGLFPLDNSDRQSKTRARYGLKGITTKGRRTIRNACYLLQRDYGNKFLTFSTVTLPNLSEDDMKVLHENWHQLVELYRLKMGRALRSEGLPGQMAGVTEIQEERWERSKAPILHGHFVFVGRRRGHGWAVSTETHDLLWSQAIETVLGKPIGLAHAACQLKRVDGNPETYLGKYASKGVKVVEEVKEKGLEQWLPKQWWNCSRRMTRQIEKEKKTFERGSQQLLVLDKEASGLVWSWYRDFSIDFEDGTSVFMARYGCLSKVGKEMILNTYT